MVHFVYESVASPSKTPNTIVPVEINIWITNPQLKKWRASVPDDKDVSIIDFGPDLYSGLVLSQDGIELKRLPDIHSESIGSKPFLATRESLNFRQLITIRGKVDKQLTESWAVVDEITRKGTMWDCEKGWHRGQGRCFTAAQIGDEVLIAFSVVTPPPAKEVRSYPWPAPK